MKPGNDTVEQIGPERHPCLPSYFMLLFRFRPVIVRLHFHFSPTSGTILTP